MSTLRWNGRELEVEAPSTAPLLDVLRDELGDKTPKPGCREGRCGACTVLLDGEPVLSCLVPLGRALDGEITTLAGGRRGRSAFAGIAEVQAGLRPRGCGAVRHLHPGDDHGRLTPSSSEIPECHRGAGPSKAWSTTCAGARATQKIREAVATLTAAVGGGSVGEPFYRSDARPKVGRPRGLRRRPRGAAHARRAGRPVHRSPRPDHGSRRVRRDRDPRDHGHHRGRPAGRPVRDGHQGPAAPRRRRRPVLRRAVGGRRRAGRGDRGPRRGGRRRRDRARDRGLRPEDGARARRCPSCTRIWRTTS